MIVCFCTWLWIESSSSRWNAEPSNDVLLFVSCFRFLALSVVHVEFLQNILETPTNALPSLCLKEIFIWRDAGRSEGSGGLTMIKGSALAWRTWYHWDSPKGKALSWLRWCEVFRETLIVQRTVFMWKSDKLNWVHENSGGFLECFKENGW